MNKIRVLCINHVSRIGGAERSLLDLLPALREEGICPTMAAPEGELLEQMRELNIPTHPLHFGRLHRSNNPVKIIRTLSCFNNVRKEIRKAVIQHSPHLLHSASITAALPTAWAARNCKLPSLWHCRDLRLPGPLMHILAHTNSHAVAISEAVAYTLKKHGIKECHTILNAINTIPFSAPQPERTKLRRSFNLPTTGPLLLTVAHMAPWKQHELTLYAAAEVLPAYPDLHIAFAGGDLFNEHPDYISGLKELAQRLQLSDHCSWLGDAENMPGLYAAADLLLHPTPCEPFGRVICEAMAARCPVVAVNKAGASEIITHEESGLLADEPNAAELALLAKQILSSPQKREAITDASHKRVISLFSVERLARQIIKLYSQLTEHHVTHSL